MASSSLVYLNFNFHGNGEKFQGFKVNFRQRVFKRNSFSTAIFCKKFLLLRPTPNQFEYIQLNETSKLLKHPYFHNDRPTMLYGFGYTEKYTSMSTQTVVSSYILRGDHNILVVEWSKYSDGFFDSIPNTNKVGAIVGKTLLTMNENGFNLSSFHLVGHSLGGHLVGFIGRSVFENSNKKFKLSRVTALDPAGPFFYGFGKISEPLKSDDGEISYYLVWSGSICLF